MSKYRARKTIVDGITFDSKLEARRYITLKEMEEQGLISDLRRQVKYELLPKQEKEYPGDTTERACYYIADFVYMLGDRKIVEDTKGILTPDFRIKRKLFRWRTGGRITVVKEEKHESRKRLKKV